MKCTNIQKSIGLLSALLLPTFGCTPPNENGEQTYIQIQQLWGSDQNPSGDECLTTTNGVSAQGGKQLTLATCFIPDMTDLISLQTSLNQGLNQEWAIQETGDGRYTIRSLQNNLCLEDEGAVSGETISLMTCDGSSAQKWAITDPEGDYYWIQAASRNGGADDVCVYWWAGYNSGKVGGATNNCTLWDWITESRQRMHWGFEKHTVNLQTLTLQEEFLVF